MPETFEYVIIGAGSAGCVIANRLATLGGAKVCVLEAGPPDTHPFIHIPAGFMKTVVDPRVNWMYDTEPSHWTGGRSIAQPRGKTLGGSGSINGHIYNRGQRLDFDTWAQLGNRGWGYADVLPYFKRAERRIGEGNDKFRGREGPLTVTDIDWQHPLLDAFINAAVSVGIPYNPDYNGESQAGVSLAQRAIVKGRRMSPARAFLHPAKKSGRLEIRPDSHVDKILFEGTRAVAVRYLRDGRRFEVHAEKEIILSAGVFNSPQILHRSGIGPAPVLSDLGVTPVHVLPGVGENLKDHVYVPIVARVKGVDTLNERSKGLRLASEVLRYLVDRSGILSLQPTLAYLSWHSDEVAKNLDLQITFTPGCYHKEYEKGLANFPGMTMAGWPHRTQSKGYVRARSTDPFVAPVIQPNYLDDPLDRHLTLAAMRLCRRLFNAPAFSRFYDGEESPGPELSSDDELLDFCRQTASTCYHPMGTCRMSPYTDSSAVVDDELRVHGLHALRVADASIMPAMVSANLNASTIMIGEKASDMILGQKPLPSVELAD